MIEHTFEAMGTQWAVLSDRPSEHGRIERIIRRLEQKLSRFLPDSALSTLNRERTSDDATLATVLRAALNLHDLTVGAFDPRLGKRLAELGYDRTFDELTPRADAAPFEVSPLGVSLSGNHVTLTGEGDIDLGGIAKGWSVDCAVETLLAAGASAVLVDGGGDIRVEGYSEAIGVGDDPDDELVVDVRSGAVATSSTQRRSWPTVGGLIAHHILDPRTGWPSGSSIETATVVAPYAALADALATAIIVDPDTQLPRIAAMGAQAAVRSLDGRWWTTPNWKETV